MKRISQECEGRGENLGEGSRFPNKEISILSQRQHLLLSERSFMLVNDGGELVKAFRSGGDELRGLGVSGLLPLTEWGGFS